MQSKRPLCFALSFSFLFSDGSIGADTGSDALRNLVRQSPGRQARTVRNFSNGGCTSERFLFWFFLFSLTRDLIFSLGSHERQTLRISQGISEHKNCCHIPKVTLRSGLLSPQLLPAAGGQEGGATGFVRSSGACVARTLQDSAVIARQSARVLFKACRI